MSEPVSRELLKECMKECASALARLGGSAADQEEAFLHLEELRRGQAHRESAAVQRQAQEDAYVEQLAAQVASKDTCACGLGPIGGLTAYSKGQSIAHGEKGCLKTDAGAEKAFTRAEVLAVLRAQQTFLLAEMMPERAMLGRLISIFERME